MQRRGLARRSLAGPLAVETKQPVPVNRRIYMLKGGEQFQTFFTYDGDIHNGGDQCRIKRCKSKTDGSEYVVKVQMKKRIRGANEALFRRMTERMMNMPEYAHVIKVEACYEDDKFFYTLMDSCKGGDLFDFFKMLANDDLSAEDFNKELQIVMRELLLSLRHLHNQGLVHQDVKLENLVFRDQGQVSLDRRSRSPSPTSSPKSARRKTAPSPPASPKVLKLIDFDFTQEWEPSSPKSQQILGTDGYIAPECYIGGLSPKSDIFSAGVILYLLVTGRFPYDDDIFDDEPGQNVLSHPKMKEIYEKLAKYKVRWSSSTWNAVPEAKLLCQRLMLFNPLERYDAEQALKDPWLCDVKTTSELVSTAASTPTTEEEKRPGSPKEIKSPKSPKLPPLLEATPKSPK
jgi:calcium-dependent protein kinase